MGINGVSDMTHASQYGASRQAKAAASFGQQLSEAAKQRTQTASAYETGIHTGPTAAGMGKTLYAEGGPTITEIADRHIASSPPGSILIFIPRENTVCSEGRGGNQYVYAEYTADSTPENPIVRIYCRAESGTYEFTRHINDIDPSNATYAEMAALYGHQVKTGEREPVGLIRSPVPIGYEVGDLMRKQNFMTGLEELSNSKMFRLSPNILQDAKAFFEFYSMLAEEKEARAAEDAEFEALTSVVDIWSRTSNGKPSKIV